MTMSPPVSEALQWSAMRTLGKKSKNFTRIKNSHGISKKSACVFDPCGTLFGSGASALRYNRHIENCQYLMAAFSPVRERRPCRDDA